MIFPYISRHLVFHCKYKLNLHTALKQCKVQKKKYFLNSIAYLSKYLIIQLNYIYINHPYLGEIDKKKILLPFESLKNTTLKMYQKDMRCVTT